jgi:hypothetical protein
MLSVGELTADIDLIKSYEGFLYGALNQITSLGDFLKLEDLYSDFCDLSNMLDFICIPDLQRIISLLMALFLLDVPNLDASFDVVKILIVPLLSPILNALATVLDRFTAMVTNPLDCVVAAINMQIQKLNITTGSTSNYFPEGYFSKKYDWMRSDYLKSKIPISGVKVESLHATAIKELSEGIKQLSAFIQEGIQRIQAKQSFYINQIKSLVDTFTGGDSAYIELKVRTLKIVRLINFIRGLIKTKGQSDICKDKNKGLPEQEELNNFYNNFLGPDSAFNARVDENGQLQIEEKVINDIFGPDNTISFNEDINLDEKVKLKIRTLNETLNKPISITKPCKLQASENNANKVNEWISELSKL